MDQNPKQQITERIKQANNILVTVSKNPTVDQLAACIGMTLFLNKLDKHATAVFSGAVPSTLEFLQPEETIEPNTDSLRDFIISLDKSKADKLRYKVEDQVVRIFITPYKTSLSEKDLVFEQGDFNVEVILALGVHEQEHLDDAITAHGRILHDATIVSINAGAGEPGHLGGINWHEPTASSLSEMLVSISESFGSNLIDNQMATAFLTGIVAETERFSNDKTSPKVMTMSAQLMAAGANQQLIANKLEVPEEPPAPPPPPAGEQQPPAPEEPVDPTTLQIKHEDKDEIHIDDVGNFKKLEEEIPAIPAELPMPEAPVVPSPPPPQAPPEKSELPQEEREHGHRVIMPDHHQPRMSGEEIAELAAKEMAGSPDGSGLTDEDTPSGGPIGPQIPLLGQKNAKEQDEAAGVDAEPQEPKPRPNPFMEQYEEEQQKKAAKSDDARPEDIQSARSAVDSANNSGPLPPIEALNAQQLGPDLHDHKMPEPLVAQPAESAPEPPKPASEPTLAVPAAMSLPQPIAEPAPELPTPQATEPAPDASPAPPPVPPPMMPPFVPPAPGAGTPNNSPNSLPKPLVPPSQ